MPPRCFFICTSKPRKRGDNGFVGVYVRMARFVVFGKKVGRERLANDISESYFPITAGVVIQSLCQ